MQSPPRAPDGDYQLQADGEDVSCPALLDLEGNFISLFLRDPAPTESLDASPYPYSSHQLDTSRVLTRLTQRLVLDINTRKQGHDAYASSSSDADGETEARKSRAAKSVVGGSIAKDARSSGKAAAVPAALRHEHTAAAEGRRRTKSKKHLTSSEDDEELDGFVVSDNAEVSE
jgi:hypothetical protein